MGQQKPVEVILMRQLASCLATPIFIVDNDGGLLFFNDPAESILGRRFDETGPISRDELWEIFRPTEADGSEMKADDHPLAIARNERHPSHKRFGIRGMDGHFRKLEATAFPLVGQSGEVLGSVGIFWEIEDW